MSRSLDNGDCVETRGEANELGKWALDQCTHDT